MQQHDSTTELMPRGNQARRAYLSQPYANWKKNKKSYGKDRKERSVLRSFFIVRKVFSVDSGCGILFGYLFITVV